MSVKRIDELQPAAASVVADYLAGVQRALGSADPAESQAVLEDVEAHILEELGATSNARDAQAVVSELGAPEEYGEGGRAFARGGAVAYDDGDGAGTGKILGMPYDVRMPTAERIASRWWNPRDPRVFMPRVWGIGWDLNFGAIAVKLHLIEPDAEDEPFGEVPRSALGAALVFPAACVAYIVVSYLVVRSTLPEQVPVHWGVTGLPDRFGDAPGAMAMLLFLAAVPTALALRSFLIRNSALRVAAVGALASLMSGLAAQIWLLTIVTARGVRVTGWTFVAGIVASLAIPLVQLTVLARIGRARELRRDLGGAPRHQR